MASFSITFPSVYPVISSPNVRFKPGWGIYDCSANKNQRRQFPSPQLIGAERQLA